MKLPQGNKFPFQALKNCIGQCNNKIPELVP